MLLGCICEGVIRVITVKCRFERIINKLQMEKSKRKRGISLSHHNTPRNNCQLMMDQSRVMQIVRPFVATIRNQTPKQTRFSSAPKPNIIFSYTKQSSANKSIPYLNSVQSNSAFSQSSNIKQQQVTYIDPPNYFPLQPKQFQFGEPPRGGVARRLFTNRKPNDNEEAFEISTQTERKNYFIYNQNGSNQSQQSLKTAFATQQYQKFIQNRKKNLGISNKVISYKQQMIIPAKNSEPFAKIQLPKEQTIVVVDKKGASKKTTEDLRSLQEMEKRLRQIINICDSKLV